jgi:hypothetical protein
MGSDEGDDERGSDGVEDVADDEAEGISLR